MEANKVSKKRPQGGVFMGGLLSDEEEEEEDEDENGDLIQEREILSDLKRK